MEWSAGGNELTASRRENAERGENWEKEERGVTMVRRVNERHASTGPAIETELSQTKG